MCPVRPSVDSLSRVLTVSRKLIPSPTYSDKIQALIYIELTSPWEANMSQAHRGKMKKYADEGLHAIPGWTTIPLCVEVGARGTTSNTFHHMCKTLGMQKRESIRLRKKVQTIAERCSYFLFLSRKVRGWDPGRNGTHGVHMCGAKRQLFVVQQFLRCTVIFLLTNQSAIPQCTPYTKHQSRMARARYAQMEILA